MKKIGKRLGALLLALVMVLSLVPMTALAARVNDDEIAIEAPGTEEAAHLAATPAEGEAPEYNDANIDAGLFDVGVTVSGNATDGWTATYSNPAGDPVEFTNEDDSTISVPVGTVIKATAASWADAWNDSSKAQDWNDHYPYYAVDGSDSGYCWHTRYTNGWHEKPFGPNHTELVNHPELRYIQLEIASGPMWLSALRYLPKNGSGDVNSYEIKTSLDGETWTTVATGSNSTRTAWTRLNFDSLVYAKYVRLYGITVYGQVASANDCMSAKEIRLVQAENQDPTVVSTTITVKTTTGTDAVILQGATVVVGGQTATTNTSGEATVTLISGQAYTATVTAADHASTTAEVTGGTATDVALTPLHRTISGTVTATGTDASPEGAVVTLVIADSHYTNVVGGPRAEVMADGTYSLNINALAAGSYKVRVSKAGYGAVISETAVTVEATETTETHSNVNATLAKIDGTPDYGWTFDNAQDQPGDDDLNKGSGVAALTYEDGGMKIKWANGDRGNNLVSIRNTNLKNGVVEFDATRGNEDLGFKDNYAVNANRFGLAMRSYSADENTSYWLYIGQDSVTYQWGVEWFKVTNSGTNGQWWNYTNDNPVSFGPNETRHFKVTVSDDTNVKLEIDGMEILSTTLATSGNNDPVDKIISSGDVGIIWGNSNLSGYGPHTVLIDNLCVFSNDPKATVSWDSSQRIKGIYAFNGENELTNGAEVPAGSKVSIQAGDDVEAGKTLGGLTVVKADDGTTTVTATQTGDGVWSFTMPEYAVTVTGELKNAFTAALPQDGSANVVPKAGKAYTLKVSEGATADYQWYRVTAGSSDVAVGTNSATYTPTSEDVGKTLKVVVTGTGDYAGIKTLTTGTVAAADVEVTGVTIARSTIKMIKNGNGTDSNTSDPANTVVSGNTTTLTATVSPDNATGLADGTVAWTVDDNTVVQLGAATRADNVFSMPITAVKNGTATVTATATSADGTTQSDSVTITVVTKVEKVTIKNGAKTVASTDSAVTGEGLILHANTGLADHPNSAALAVEVYPEDATTPAFNWARADGQDTGLLTINGDAADGSRTFTVNDTSDAKKVGTKDFKLTVTSADVGGASTKELTFNVTVRRYLQNPISIGLGGKTAPTIGQQMEADVSQLVVGIDQTTSESAKANLTYQWYALDSADAEIAENATPIHSGTGTAGKTYTPAAADAAQLVGKRIAVRVTATPTDSFFYEGAVTAKTTNAVVKMDGPDAPVLSPTKPATGGAENSGYITITNYASYADGTAFQIKAGDAGEWNDAAVTSEGKIENLTAGKYFVKVKETAAQLESAVSETTIAVADAREYNITATQPAEGATISVTDKAVENAEVTITLNVAEGWKVDAVTVTDADNGSVTANREGTTNVWKFSMPAKDVTVTATVSKIQLKIKHTLTNITCGLGALDQEHEHTVDWGAVTTITFTPADGYTLPTATGVGGLTVKLLNDDGTESDELYSARHTLTYNPDPENPGKYILGFGSNGLRSSISITAAATLKSYTVSFAEMNGLNRPQATQSVNHGGTYTYTLTPMANYALPENITVTMAGNASPAYTYNKTTGAIEIQNVTGAVTITANGVRQYDQVTGVSIEDPTSLEVDSILSSSVQPAGAVVSYQWMSSATENGTYADIAGANTQTYTLKAADVGKYIKLKVTGDNDHNYDGTQTSAAVGPVVAKTVAVTGITLDKTTHTMSVGQTVELTATITPDNATDKTITWRVLAEGQDTEVTNATITPVPGSDNKVIVTAVSVGTVRINARTANGLTRNCTLIIERPNVYAVTYMTHGESAQASISTEDGTVTNENNTVEAGKTVTVAVTPANEAHFVTVTATANNTAVALTKGSGNTWTFTMPGYPVSIDINVTSEQPQTPHTVTFTLNGAALAEVTGGTASGNVVTVADNGTLTFKLTVTDTAKEVKSVKVDGAAITPVEGVYTISAITADKNVVVEVGDKGVTPPAVNTAALEAAITAATQAKAGVRTYETEMDPAEVSRGTKYTTDAAMGTLNTAITAAEAALTAETQAEVDLAVETLNAAVTAFNATVKTGTKASSSSTSSRPSTSTETTTNPDGSKTTTVTDNRTGTVTATTEKPDGTVEVVETKKDGTVTETVTTPEGAKTEKITTPDKDVTITVTDAEGEELAKVELPAVIPNPETRFDDVPEGHWADKAIHNAAALELIEGVGDNKFGIHSTMTRGALATVLHRLSQGKTDYETAFQDVAQGKYYTEGVAWAAKAGVVKGFNADIFAPDQIITREQLAVMLARYAKLVGLDTKADAKVLETFADGENTGSWAVDGVAWCVENGILQGKGGSALDPTANVSRAEAAVMLDRFIGLMK